MLANIVDVSLKKQTSKIYVASNSYKLINIIKVDHEIGYY